MVGTHSMIFTTVVVACWMEVISLSMLLVKFFVVVRTLLLHCSYSTWKKDRGGRGVSKVKC